MTFAVVANTKFTDTETEVNNRFWYWIENIPVRGWRKKTIQKNKKIVMDTMSIFHQDYLSLFFRKFKKRIISQEYQDRDICSHPVVSVIFNLDSNIFLKSILSPYQ